MTPHAIILRAQTADGRHTTKRIPGVRRFRGWTVRRLEPGTEVVVDFYCANTGTLCDTVTLFDLRPDESVEWTQPLITNGGVWVEATGLVVGAVYAE